jgi:hypothetical protein
MSQDEISALMKNAKDDLTASISGRFSPGDWEKILELAKIQLAQRRREQDGLEAWKETIRDFHRSAYWGFKPDYRPSRVAKKKNRGIAMGLVWMTFQSMVLTKVAVLWLGQNYSNGDDSLDKWLFFILLLLIPANGIFFIWRNRHYRDGEQLPN